MTKRTTNKTAAKKTSAKATPKSTSARAAKAKPQRAVETEGEFVQHAQGRLLAGDLDQRDVGPVKLAAASQVFL